MILHCIRYLTFTKNNSIKIQCETDGKTNLDSLCIDYGFRKFTTIDKKVNAQKLKKTKNVRIMLLSNCAVCGNKKSRFIKEQEASGICSSFGINIPLINKIPKIG